MSKTLQDIAEKHKIHKPALYARLKKLEEVNPDKELSYKKSNVLYLTDTGVKLLEENLRSNPVNSKKDNRTKKATGSTQDRDRDLLVETMKGRIQTLERQLEAKQEEINRLLNIIDKLNDSVSEGHRLVSQEQTLQAQSKLQALEVIRPDTGLRNVPVKRKSLISKLIITGRLFRGDYD